MSFDAGQGTHRVGEGLFRELVWVHDVLRRDLAAVRALADQVSNGLPADEAGARARSLQTSTGLWQLKVNCMVYCRFVDGHHHLEDTALFPALRRTNPAIAHVVDQLEADHRTVAAQVRAVEDAAETLARHDTPEARRHLVRHLHALSEQLLAHLAFEEDAIGPTMRSWQQPP